MKKYIYILIGALVFTMGCNDDAIRIPEVGEGVQVRVQFQDGMNFFDFSDIENAKIRYSIFTENTNLDSVIISVTYEPSCDDCDPVGPVMARIYGQSDFSNGIIADEELSAQNIVDLLGVDIADLEGGDNFVISNRVVLNNGLSYPGTNPLGNVNIEPAITGSSATNSFTATLDVLVGCPLVEPFTGVYLLEQVSGSSCWYAQSCGADEKPIFPAQEVTLSVGGNPITRNFSIDGYLAFDLLGFPASAVSIVLLCDQTVGPSATPASCGVDLGYAGILGGSYDAEDDSEIVIELLDNYAGLTACGGNEAPAQNNPTVLTLTKQ